MSFDADVLATQLARLGVDLQEEIRNLAMLEHACVDAESTYRHAAGRLQCAIDEAFCKFSGTVGERQAIARSTTQSYFLDAEDAWRAWQVTKADVRIQQASLSALHKRIDIGRSLLSREKALLSLGGIGEI